jgi:DNA-binding transcriptional LysR family regulator
MTLHQLKVFLAVAKHSSITKASQELHISEPSVHQQVKSLQMNFSRSLYQKIGRVIEITSDGRSFSAKASEILRKAAELEKEFGQCPAASSPRHLTVGGSHVLSASILAPIVATFKTRSPDVQIEFRTKSSQFIERLVLTEKVDLGLVSNVSSSPLLIVEPFRYEEMVVIVSKQHALSKKRELTMAELAQGPLIVRTRRNSSPSRQILGELEQHGFEVNVLMKCDSAQGVKVAVAKGLGIGLLYRSHVEQEVSRGELKVLDVSGLKKRIQSFIIYKPGRPISSAAHEFLKLLRQFREPKPTRTRQSVASRQTSHVSSTVI